MAIASDLPARSVPQLALAKDGLWWAEERLRAVEAGSPDHGLAVLNKAAYHEAIGEDHLATSVDTPLRADAFDLDDETKIELIEEQNPEWRDLFDDLAEIW